MDMNVEKCRERIHAYVREKGFSGVIRISEGDRVLLEYAIGFEDAERKIALSKDSRFTFYSLSKPFCAIGLMRLAERGLVCLEEHPSLYLPILAGRFHGLCLRQLLNHTSGLPDFLREGALYERFGKDAQQDARSLLPLLLEQPPLFAPGKGAQYANVNFVLIAMIIEAVTGEAYADYMRREVFLPLGLETAVVDTAGLQIEHRVVGYGRDEAGKLLPVRKDYYGMLGAGDIVGTLADACCLPRAIRKKALLCEASWREILTPSPLNHMGFGCTVALWHGRLRILHTGGSAGFRNMHILLPQENLDFMLLSNYGFGFAREELAELVYECAFESNGGASDPVELDKGFV